MIPEICSGAGTRYDLRGLDQIIGDHEIGVQSQRGTTHPNTIVHFHM